VLVAKPEAQGLRSGVWASLAAARPCCAPRRRLKFAPDGFAVDFAVPLVLLIDDDEAVLDVLAVVCEDAGFEVQTARDGRAGLAASGARTS